MPVHSRPSRSARYLAGFSLIDLLVALAVLGVLVGLAFPSFQEQVARARRAEMQSVLVEDAGYMQRYYAAHDAYASMPGPSLTYPVSPRSGSVAYLVTVAVPVTDPTRFVLTASRTGAMAGDRCGDFTYDNLGRRDLVAGSPAPGVTAAMCWR